jgi:hypothetical protein
LIISISQPTVFPWIGYFNIIKSSDVFVFLDNVKFEKHSWQMRNRIKEVTKNKDSEVWIRIPTKNVKSDTLINQVLIDNTQKWKINHIKTFKINYGKNYDEIEFLQAIYNKEWENLAAFNIESITNCCNFLQINTKLIKASELTATGRKGELVLNICKELGATEYLTSVGAKNYLEDHRTMFEKENIKIIYHDYKHPIYKQKGTTFLENLSILDLIFNEKNNAKEFI